MPSRVGATHLLTGNSELAAAHVRLMAITVFRIRIRTVV
jgi:hypothetical protein